MEDPVAVRSVTKRYGDVTALGPTDLTFEPGGVYALAGPNGSGKTTLLRMLAGLTRPSGGTVEVPGDVGVGFQGATFYPDLTVAENLEVFTDLVDADRDWGAHLVEQLRLTPMLHRKGSALSDGYAKKLDTALALLKEPDVLLLDEPLADIDDATERKLVDLLAAYRSPDRAIVVSSHNLDSLSRLLDRLTVVVDASVVFDAPTDEFGDRSLVDVYGDLVAEHA